MNINNRRNIQQKIKIYVFIPQRLKKIIQQPKLKRVETKCNVCLTVVCCTNKFIHSLTSVAYQQTEKGGKKCLFERLILTLKYYIIILYLR